jgi:hypothetical protein
MEVEGARRTLVTARDTMQYYNPDSYTSKVSRTNHKKFGGRTPKTRLLDFANVCIFYRNFVWHPSM